MSETKSSTEGGTPFLDRIWLQAFLATGITVAWLIWIMYEILVKAPPGGA